MPLQTDNIPYDKKQRQYPSVYDLRTSLKDSTAILSARQVRSLVGLILQGLQRKFGQGNLAEGDQLHFF